MVVSIFTEICKHYSYLIFEYFFLSPPKKRVLISNQTPFLILLVPGSHSSVFGLFLYMFSINLPILDISLKWIHIMCALHGSQPYHGKGACVAQ